MRFFNTTGVCEPERHYMLPASRRVPGLREHVERMQYVVVHAPRQSGKSTALSALARELTASGEYVAVLVSLEVGSPFHSDIDRLEPPILASWDPLIRVQLPPELRPPAWPEAPPGARLGTALAEWARKSTRPLVVFLDEVDALRDEALVSVLRQLRTGFFARPTEFPSSVALVGLRDVRDYVVASGGSGRLGSASPFNIKVASITLENFTQDDVAELYTQHTAETGQVFDQQAVERAWILSGGQPWLVNAIAAQLVDVVVTDRGVAIRANHVDLARDILIRRQDTHLDSLAERLREPRVRSIIEPILAGGTLGDVPEDDRRYVLDLGLVRATETGGFTIANPIYREVIARTLAAGPRASLPAIAPSWLDANGTLHIGQLLDSFLGFWRQNGWSMLGSAPYGEVAAQLVMMAWLDRVANGGGRVDREYAIGSGRIDLCLHWGGQRFAFELKTWRTGRPDPVLQGLGQLDEYLAGLGLETGWLVVFDQRKSGTAAGENAYCEEATTPGGRTVTVVRA